MAQHTANEQYLLELINRARLNPEAEVAIYNAAVSSGAFDGPLMADLNANLPPGTLDGTSKQPLAPNTLLQDGAAGHSAHMLDVDQFAHDGIGDGDIGTRATDVGYAFNLIGENIAFTGTTGVLDAEAAIDSHHFGLFESFSHRTNILGTTFTEIGLGQALGVFTSNGTDFNTSMVTQSFGHISGSLFLTGVAYDDTDSDSFYSIGEGTGGVSVSAGGTATVTEAAGGYGIAVANGTHEVTVGAAQVSVEVTGRNVKLDLVDGDTLLTSGSVTLTSGVETVTILGLDAVNVTGSAGDENLRGNVANNHLSGGAGEDTLTGGTGEDTLDGGEGRDLLRGGRGRDTLEGGTENDQLRGQRDGDHLDGGAGNDNLKGGGGNDTILGGEGDDFINGGSRADALDGGAGNDNLIGRSFSDTLTGGAGDDKLNAGGGEDRLEGGSGSDVLKGGADADVFILNTGFEADAIIDFTISEDRLEISAALAAGRTTTEIAALAEVSGNDIVLDFGGGDILTLRSMADVTGLADQFDIV